MNQTIKMLFAAVLLLGVAAGGYWYGQQETGNGIQGKQETAKGVERKLLYYRNPMGLPDTSPVPKKDPMGMDYIAVYEGEGSGGAEGEVAVDPARLQKLGVKSEPAARRTLTQSLRLTGRIEANERTLYTIAPKFEGWVERLHANTTGQVVKKGEPLFEVYSPELVSVQRERELAEHAQASLVQAAPEARAGMEGLARAAEERMRNWDVRAADVTRNGRIVYRAPSSGIVLEKKAVEGMRFMAGEMLYRIADLSSVWIIADVPEREIGAVKTGDAVEVQTEAFPQRRWLGRVDFIYPVMNEMTRTVPVRIEVANRDASLKPAMYAQAQIDSGARAEVLAIPASAVIDSGMKQVVLVTKGEGRFAPREVKLGIRGGDYVEVLEGVAVGEEVVTSANFLLDSESNLKAALGGMSDATASVGRDSSRQNSVGLKPDLQSKVVGHLARGKLESVNEDGTASITHGPIPSLKWPGMTMDFALANPSLAANMKPGTPIEFEIVERGEGEWVVTRMSAKEAGDAEHDH